jgi:hypothetical protein
MPTGRPKLISGANIRKVADCFFDGLTDDETALLCGIHVKTIKRARAGEFCPEIKKAEAGRLQFYLRAIRDGKQRDWVRIAWFLERRYPERFARPEIQLSFNNNYTQNNLSINITSSEAKEIEAIAEPVRRNVKEMFSHYKPGQLGNGNGNGHDEVSS